MKAIFLDRQSFTANICLTSIKSEVSSLTCYPSTQHEQVIERCQDAEIIITNKVILNKELLVALPALKLICITATGINNVDILSAESLGITVTNVKGYAKNSVAQYIFAHLLTYFNQPQHHYHNSELGLWSAGQNFCYHGNGSIELAGKTIGIIGYGDLGQAVATIANAFNMKVMVAERQDALVTRDGRYSFNEVIEQADVISLHCPQTDQTLDLIDKKKLTKMKKNTVLINTARGAIINNEDLHQALKAKQIAFAVLDVLEQEPPPSDHLFLKQPLDNLKITAHIAWASIEAQQRLIELVAKNIKQFKQTDSAS
jgi:glycerate dehydrogenase